MAGLIALAACSSVPTEAEQAAARDQMLIHAAERARAQCLEAGHIVQTQPYADCFVSTASALYAAETRAYASHVRAIEANENARWAAAGMVLAAGAAASAAAYSAPTYYAPAPTSVTCQQFGTITRCY